MCSVNEVLGIGIVPDFMKSGSALIPTEQAPCQDQVMSTTPSPKPPLPYGQGGSLAVPYPTYVRPRSGRVVAGVASGVAVHLGVDVFYVRLAFLVGALLSGLGVFVYAGLWMVSKTSSDLIVPPRRVSLPRPLNIAMALLGGIGFVVSIALVTGLSGAALIPLILAGVGAFLAWQAYDRGLNSGRSYISIIGGSALVLSGVVLAVFSADQAGGFATAFLSVGLTLAGVVALGLPPVLRLWDNLAQERAAKAAADERAVIASRLHDSVLQTLALIQKRSDNPDEVLRLARGQERELRQWLFDAEEKSSQSIFAAVETACGEVEDLFGIRIAPVTVGTDQDLTDDSQVVILAAREAMVNAAKHAGVDKLDVYAELLGGELSIFVRDRGAGFDPADIPSDRHGIRESIHGRLERVGGKAMISSTLGEGTEVSLRIQLPVP